MPSKHSRATFSAECRSAKCARLLRSNDPLQAAPASTTTAFATKSYVLAGAGALEVRRLGGSVYVSQASVDAYRASLKPPAGWLTVPQAIKRYGYGRSALYVRMRRHEIAALTLHGRTYLCRADLEKRLKPHGDKTR